MNFLKKFSEFIGSPSHSRTMGILLVFVLAAAVSLTVIAGQQQQNLKQKASHLDVCSSISTIPTCAPSLQSGSNFSCSSEGEKCKIDQAVYECQKPKGDGGEGD